MLTINDEFFLQKWTEEYLNEKLESPRIWATLNNGFEIQELKSNKINEVLKIIQVINNNLFILF